MDISKQGFLEFCIAQGDEIIEHNSGMSYEESAWSNCAVGAYYTHLTGDRLTIDNVGDHDGPDYFPEQLGELIGEGHPLPRIHVEPKPSEDASDPLEE